MIPWWERWLQQARQRLVDYLIARGPVGRVGAATIGLFSVVIVGIQMLAIYMRWKPIKHA